MKRSRMKPVSRKRAARDRNYPAAREAVFERARGSCEAMISDRCSARCEQVHHLAGRGGPDPHRLGNLLGVCASCHEWIEINRARAYDLGFLIRRAGPALPAQEASSEGPAQNLED